jgi:hypothetical protein
MHNYAMYIVAIGWLYVAVLLAVTERSVVAGIITFIFYGLLPAGLVIWFSGSRVRRERRKHRESMADQLPDEKNGADPKADQ